MKSKVMLFNAEGAQVGETFMRRARQLVNQQRAEWINDEAIRFSPDAGIAEGEWKIDPGTETESKLSEKDALLYYIANKRLKERKDFIIHSLLMLPGYALFLVIALSMHHRSDYVFLAISWSAWTSPYLMRAYSFIRDRLHEYRPNDRARVLEAEVNKLRSLLK